MQTTQRFLTLPLPTALPSLPPSPHLTQPSPPSFKTPATPSHAFLAPARHPTQQQQQQRRRQQQVVSGVWGRVRSGRSCMPFSPSLTPPHGEGLPPADPRPPTPPPPPPGSWQAARGHVSPRPWFCPVLPGPRRQLAASRGLNLLINVQLDCCCCCCGGGGDGNRERLFRRQIPASRPEMGDLGVAVVIGGGVGAISRSCDGQRGSSEFCCGCGGAADHSGSWLCPICSLASDGVSVSFATSSRRPELIAVAALSRPAALGRHGASGTFELSLKHLFWGTLAGSTR
ncbi:unnamed protein product [Merluccius merluccius]